MPFREPRPLVDPSALQGKWKLCYDSGTSSLSLARRAEYTHARRATAPPVGRAGIRLAGDPAAFCYAEDRKHAPAMAVRKPPGGPVQANLMPTGVKTG